MANQYVTSDFGMASVWLVFVPCIALSVVVAALFFIVMGAGMAMTFPPVPISSRIGVYVVNALFLLPAAIVLSLWKNWVKEPGARRWLIIGGYVLGSFLLFIGLERSMNDSGDWFIHQPVWLCGVFLLLAARIMARHDRAFL